MPTVSANLDTSQYVQVNTGSNPIMLQSHRDTVRIVLNETKPALSNTVYHELSGADPILQLDSIDTNVWALAMTDRSALTVTESKAFPGRAGVGDLTTDVRGVQKFVQDFSLFHSVFTFTVHPDQWIIYEDAIETPNASSTRGTSVDGHLNVTSGAVAGNSCFVESRRHPRYQPDRGVKWAASVGFKGANLDGILKAGFIVNGENGAYLKTKGDGNLYAVILNDGTETHEELITFPFDIDITKGNLYDIQLQWRGVGFARFYAENPANGATTLIHEINFLNTLDEEVFIRNPAMSAGFHAVNTTQEVSLWSGCVDITSEGGRLDREQYGEHSFTRTVTAVTPNVNCITAVRNPQLAPNGKINTRDLNLARVTVKAAAKCTVKLYRTRDITAFTGGTWNTTRTGSFVEAADNITTADPTKMEEFATFDLAAGEKDSRDNPSKETIDFFGIHGDYMAALITSGNNVEVTVNFEWGEEV